MDLFIHIPKTGGTTLSTTLRWVYRQRVYRTAFGNATEARGELANMPDVRLAYGHMLYGGHRYVEGPHRYFTMLRNPVTRIISLFYYIQQAWPESPVAEMTLKEYLASGHHAYRHNDQVRLIAGMDPNQEDPQRCLERAKQHLGAEFAAVGLLERFDESVVLFRRLLGWSRWPVYVRANRTDGRPARAEVATSTRALIAEQNTLDRALYDYATQHFETQLDEVGRDQVARDVRCLRRLNRVCGFVAPPVLHVYRAIRRTF